MQDREDLKKWMFLILFGVLSYFLVNNLILLWNIIVTIFNVFLPFILGGAIAFILNIPMTKIENFILKRVKNDKLKPLIRIVSIALSLIIFVLIIGSVLFLLIPELVENIESLINNIPVLSLLFLICLRITLVCKKRLKRCLIILILVRF